MDGKRLTINNFEKLEGTVITARYRDDINEPANNRSASFTVSRVKDMGGWLWVVAKGIGPTTNSIQFRIYKDIYEGGYVRVEKRYKTSEREVNFVLVIGEVWECSLPLRTFATPSGFAYSLSTTGWDWLKYIDNP